MRMRAPPRDHPRWVGIAHAHVQKLDSLLSGETSLADRQTAVRRAVKFGATIRPSMKFVLRSFVDVNADTLGHAVPFREHLTRLGRAPRTLIAPGTSTG